MQKKLLRDTQTDIAKGVAAYAGAGKIQVYIDGKEKDFEKKDIKIEIFRRQLQHWFFDAAEILKENEDNHFVLMMICATYIEAIHQYKTGKSSKNKSGVFFSESLKDITKIGFESELNHIYSALRCGLFHNSMVSENIRLVNFGEDAISVNSGIININCIKFYECITNDFTNYIDALKSADENSGLYINFKKMFKFS